MVRSWQDYLTLMYNIRVMKLPKPDFRIIFSKKLIVPILVIALLIAGNIAIYNLYQTEKSDRDNLVSQLELTENELLKVQTEDPYKTNKELLEQITNINKVYKDSISVYENLQDLKSQNQKTADLDKVYAAVVSFLADKNYASASSSLKELSQKIEAQTTKVATTPPANQPQANLPVSNTPPGAGFAVQNVSVDGATYRVALVAADLNSTKVIIDTASESDCRDNCPVLPLGDYIARNGAIAGINGSYFCPAEYPSCAGKTGSFDTLVMNKNKKYFNSDNNVYSTIPAAIFSAGSARFVGQSSQWGRDTGVDGVIANYPLLVSGNNVVFTEAPNEPKFGGKAARTFIAAKGSTVYIGIVYGATMGESAKVLHALGMGDAMNLDQGGSTALWSGGYKAGPGRSIPNAILFVRR